MDSEAQTLKLNHKLVVEHYKGKPSFVKYIKNKTIAIYEVNDKLAKKIYKLKKYLLIYKEDGKYCHKYVNNLAGDKKLGQGKKSKSLGTGISKGRKSKVKKRNKKTKTT